MHEFLFSSNRTLYEQSSASKIAKKKKKRKCNKVTSDFLLEAIFSVCSFFLWNFNVQFVLYSFGLQFIYGFSVFLFSQRWSMKNCLDIFKGEKSKKKSCYFWYFFFFFLFVSSLLNWHSVVLCFHSADVRRLYFVIFVFNFSNGQNSKIENNFFFFFRCAVTTKWHALVTLFKAINVCHFTSLPLKQNKNQK